MIKFFRKWSILEKQFCFLWYSPLPFFTTFLALESFQLFSKTYFGLWLVSLCVKFLMCFRTRLLCWSFVLDVPMDARKMMPYGRNFQSWLILLIHFIQFLKLIFVDKFTFPKTLNNDIYFIFIAFFIVLFCPWAVLPLNFINYLLKTNVSAGNKYFYYIIIINCIKNNDS